MDLVHRTHTDRRVDLLALAGFVAATLAVGFTSSLLQGDALDTWYTTIDKPSFNPPDWVFGPVWSALYVLMAVAAWLDWRRIEDDRAKAALGLFTAQLALNAAWTGIFFGLEQPGWALAELVVQLGLVIAWVVATWRPARSASLLLLPLVAWLTFAGALNTAIVLMN